jgi:cytochrome P450
MMRFAADPVGAHRAFAARYGDPFTMRLPGMRMVVTGDAETVRRVLALPIDAFGVLDVGAEVMGAYSLVRLNGAAHAAARKQVAPLVMNPLRQGNGAAIQAIARRIYAGAAGTRVPMINLAKRLTLQVILRSAIGDLPAGEEARFAAAYAALQSKASFMLHFLPLLQVDLGPPPPRDSPGPPGTSSPIRLCLPGCATRSPRCATSPTGWCGSTISTRSVGRCCACIRSDR